MSWKNTNELSNLVDLKDGETLEGIYTGRVEHVTKKDDTIIILSFDVNGEVKQLIGSGKLLAGMKGIEAGDKVKIEYKGMGECENPKQAGEMTKFHDFDVFKWEDK